MTGDGNFIDVRFSVQYRVEDPVAFAYRLAEPEALVRSLTLAALRAIVATGAIDAVYTTDRGAIEQQVQERVQARLDGYGAGLELLSVRLLYVHPPEEVHDAFRDVASAQEDKLRTINRARPSRSRRSIRPWARRPPGSRPPRPSRAQRVRHAEGDAAGFELKVDAYRQAPELTRFRLQLETAEAALPGVQKFVRPGADDLKDLDLWLLEPFGASAQVMATTTPRASSRRRRTLLLALGALALWAAMGGAVHGRCDRVRGCDPLRSGAARRRCAGPASEAAVRAGRGGRPEPALFQARRGRVPDRGQEERRDRSLALWRIADPARFLETLATRASAESPAGRRRARRDRRRARRPIPSSRWSRRATRPAGSGTLVAEVQAAVAAYALPAYGIEVLERRRPPARAAAQNQAGVFERMKAERGKIARQYRSEGERDAKPDDRRGRGGEDH